MGLFGNKEERTKHKQEALEKYGKVISSCMSKYVGGNLALQPNAPCIVVAYEKGLGLFADFIPYERLQPVEIKTEEQISKDVTLTRLLLVGIFAFGLKKKRVSKEQYLIVNYNDDNGIGYNGIFQIPDTASSIAQRINNARNKYLKEHPALSDQASFSQDPIEQIKKLAELKEAGIISAEEFESKKVELLKKV